MSLKNSRKYSKK